MALPGSGSDALASFVAGNGDVLLAYENDSIEARAAGDDVDYIVPDDTLLIQNPARRHQGRRRRRPRTS